MATQKVQQLQQALQSLKEIGSNETKSTAGDKHETALAMLQIEQEQKRAQLKELEKIRATLANINPLLTTVQIVQGSLIKTNKGYFFMSAALGKSIIENETIYAISAQSPLGSRLMGLKVSGTVSLNNTVYEIEKLT